jgi:hypothetical protein
MSNRLKQLWREALVRRAMAHLGPGESAGVAMAAVMLAVEESPTPPADQVLEIVAQDPEWAPIAQAITQALRTLPSAAAAALSLEQARRRPRRLFDVEAEVEGDLEPNTWLPGEEVKRAERRQRWAAARRRD